MTPERIAELRELYDPKHAPWGSGRGFEAINECLDAILTAESKPKATESERPKRWNWVWTGYEDGEMEEDEKGEYVRFEDYHTLTTQFRAEQDKNKALEGALEKVCKAIRVAEIEMSHAILKLDNGLVFDQEMQGMIDIKEARNELRKYQWPKNILALAPKDNATETGGKAKTQS
jgi:hypothetical protein